MAGNEEEEASALAKEMKQLHANGDGIPYEDMACLFRKTNNCR